jgi:hypothetical protein
MNAATNNIFLFLLLVVATKQRDISVGGRNTTGGAKGTP